MPRFDTNGDIELTISPKKFFDECSLAEQNALCDLVMDEYDLVYEDDNLNTPPSPRSFSEGEFYKNLATLEENWLSMDPNDAKIVEVLAKKYG